LSGYRLFGKVTSFPKCPACNGKKIDAEKKPCKKCGGKGYIVKEEELDDPIILPPPDPGRLALLITKALKLEAEFAAKQRNKLAQEIELRDRLLKNAKSSLKLSENVIFKKALGKEGLKKCSQCGKELSLPYKCRECNKNYCVHHRLPEEHKCEKMHNFQQQGPVLKKQLEHWEGKGASEEVEPCEIAPEEDDIRTLLESCVVRAEALKDASALLLTRKKEKKQDLIISCFLRTFKVGNFSSIQHQAKKNWAILGAGLKKPLKGVYKLFFSFRIVQIFSFKII